MMTQNNMLTRLTIYGFLISWMCGFLLATTFIPNPYVDTTPVIHVEKQITYYDKQATFTAYNSVKTQTDGDECMAAGNHNLCKAKAEDSNKCIIATRLYPLHTRLQVEGIPNFCEVLDRTSAKYGNRIDIFMDKDIDGAINFGKKELKYRVIN